MPDVLTIAVRLRLLRASWHVSQGKLAEAANLSRNTVTQIESDKDESIKVYTLRALSAAMDVPMTTWFLSDSEWLEWFRIYRANAHPQLGSCAS